MTCNPPQNDEARRLAFLGRARRDLEEVKCEGNPAIRLFPHVERDAVRICLVLTPYGGQWNGLRLHFDVELPLVGTRVWPVFPPKMKAKAGFAHPLFPPGKAFILSDYSHIKSTDDEGNQRRWRVDPKPTDTLLHHFERVLDLISACRIEVTMHNDGWGDTSREYTFEAAKVTTYMTESHFVRMQMPTFSSCCRKAPICCDCGPLVTGHQRKYKEMWDSDFRPEIHLASYQSDAFTPATVHKVKSPEPDPERVHQLQTYTPRWQYMAKTTSRVTCALCPYGSSELPHIAPPVIPVPPGTIVPASLLHPPPSCNLNLLLDDNLAGIAGWLPIASVTSFALAYRRFDRVVSQFHILQLRALRCSLLRTPHTTNILGVRITDFCFWPESEEGPAWLSLAGFEAHPVAVQEVRPWDNPGEVTIHERPTLFIPLALNRQHFEVAKPEIERRLDMLHAAVCFNTEASIAWKCPYCREAHAMNHGDSYNPNFDTFPSVGPLKGIRMLIHWMGQIATRTIVKGWQYDRVKWRRTKPGYRPSARASSEAGDVELVEGLDKAVQWHGQLLHLALSVCRDSPEAVREAKKFILKSPIVTGTVEHSNDASYDADQEMRMVIGTLTIISILEPSTGGQERPLSWSMINGPFLRSFFSYTAEWWASDVPSLQVMEQGPSDFRLQKTFEAMRGYLLPLMVHISFMTRFAETYASNLDLLDDHYGFVEAKLTERLKKDIVDCATVKSWPGFFRQIRWANGERMSKAGFCELLRNTMQEHMKEVDRWRDEAHRRFRHREYKKLQAIRLLIRRDYDSLKFPLVPLFFFLDHHRVAAKHVDNGGCGQNKNKSQGRYLKKKKERRKQRTKVQKAVNAKKERESKREEGSDEDEDESSEEEEDEKPEPPVKEQKPPRKRQKLDTPQPEDAQEVEVEENMDVDRTAEGEEDVAMEELDEAEEHEPPAHDEERDIPEGALPSFPLPAHPDAPSQSTLALQGLDQHIIDADIVHPSTVIPIPDGEDDGGTRLSEKTRKRLKELGITELFAVQTALIPYLIPESPMERALYRPFNPPQDVCVSAPTGSGKTLAYVLPILELLQSRVVTRLRALVVLPTRDLVVQVRETFEALNKGRGLKIGSVSGQHSFAHEQAQLVYDKQTNLLGGSSKVDILICTPGRLMDHLLGTPNFSLQHLRFLVVDEADRLLAQSFQDWLSQVLSAIRTARKPDPTLTESPSISSSIFDPHPDALSPNNLHLLPVPHIPTFLHEEPESSCQKLLFSATLTRDPGKIAALELRDPKYVIVQGNVEESKESNILKVMMEKFAMPETLREHMIVTDTLKKPLMMFHLVHAHNVTNALVFTKSAESTTRLLRLFEFFEEARVAASPDGSSSPIVAKAYSSDLSNQERRAILEEFKAQKINILICSDLISRGMDISHVSHVVSYDVPVDIRKYVHRVGRTARAGREGDSWTLVEEQEARHFKQMLTAADHLQNVKRERIPEKAVEELMPYYEAALEKLRKVYARS
ncbi:hypothetical protein NMY22_g8781 [Coprinellus aureogranulatus]|nr:hypothetical protein NMY22_g8781 [Coprinellus aureogranulatus]